MLAKEGALLREDNDEFSQGYSFIEASVQPYL